jgi:hypothetical protein
LRVLRVTIISLLLVSGSYLYAYRRTDGNVYKSLIFSLFCLELQLGLFSPRLGNTSTPRSEETQIKIVRMAQAPPVDKYTSLFHEYRPSGLYMSNIEQPSLIPQHYHSQKLINELRAGGSSVTQAAWLLITIWMLQH